MKKPAVSKGDTDVAPAGSLILDRAEAVSAKRAAQSAYDRIDRVRKTLFGSRAEDLDHAMRDLSVTSPIIRRPCHPVKPCMVYPLAMLTTAKKFSPAAALIYRAPRSTPPGGSP